MDVAFYRLAEAVVVADNILYYQSTDGGWPKNIDMTTRGLFPGNNLSTIDNDATIGQIRYLAHMVSAWPERQKYRDAFYLGLNWIFQSQYGNGGWPQSWPWWHSPYMRHVTFNDNAMVGVLEILRDLVYKCEPFSFVDREMRRRAQSSLERGVACIINTQILVEGRKTGWCAQHDVTSLKPVGARSYELPSESGHEGADVLSFLMSLDLDRIENYRQGLIGAVEAAALFYEGLKVDGVRWQNMAAPPAVDMRLVHERSAGPAWARFYELEPPFRPFFCGRDGIKKYDVMQIENERRNGYAWWGTWPDRTLALEYPRWATQWRVGR